jgi:hypothetical protein
MSGALHIDDLIVAQLLRLVPLALFAGLGGAVFGVVRLRTARRRRLQLERLATALRLPAPAIARASDGRLGFNLPAGGAFDVPSNDGGYRGVRPSDEERVPSGVRPWTALSAPIRRTPGVVRVRPSASRDLHDSLVGYVHPLGDAAFDDAFIIHASSATAASRVLGLELRRLLLRLPRSDESPRLTIDGCAIRLEWHGEPDAALVQTAASALRRAASVCG